jgi:hypothetical protein
MMKQRAGLGKKVSSIFDGVPLPNAVQEIEQEPQRAEPPMPPMQRPAEVTVTPPRQMPPSLSQTLRAAPVAPPQMPQIPRTVQTIAPQPKTPVQALPKKTVNAPLSADKVSDGSWQQMIHKMFFSGNAEIDSRNRRALVLVGILLMALVGVLWWMGIFSGTSTGSRGQNVAVAATDAAAESRVRIDWVAPPPYPDTLRDPMQIGSASKAGSSGSGNGSGSSSATGGNLLVKSIVYVRDNPKDSTAMVNGQILHEGQGINETKIVKISPDSVEFTASGKSWKQQVE